MIQQRPVDGMDDHVVVPHQDLELASVPPDQISLGNLSLGGDSWSGTLQESFGFGMGKTSLITAIAGEFTNRSIGENV